MPKAVAVYMEATNSADLDREVVPTVRTGNSDFLACLFPCQAAFNKLSW